MVSSSSELELEYLAPCTHEEADYRMILHISDLVRNNFTKVRVRSNDTDVLAICTAYFHEIPGLEELWLAFGTSKSFRLIPVHIIAMQLGADKCKALLGFHALTGCDSVSALFGIGKKTAWTMWMAFPKFTEAFLFLSNKSDYITNEIMALTEEFVARLYCCSVTPEHVTTVKRLRYELFHFGCKDFNDLPPTLNALQLHTRRAAYTAGHIWGQALIKAPTQASPALWGYKLQEGNWQPEWTTIPTISKKHLTVCRCKMACKPPCACATKQVCCTSLCTCHGECYGQPHQTKTL